MTQKVMMGLVWFAVFYFLACVIVGGVAGAMAGANDPAHAQQAGGIAGQQAVTKYYYVILFGSIALATVGAATGILPGTRSKPKD